MNITIEIHYIASSRLMQKGSFPLRGKKAEQVALQFWKDIKKELPFNAELEQVVAANEEITKLVKEMEKRELEFTFNDDLPF
ncbi:hypothetical protein [Neobacillus cucumis]|uniref:hypothetical protein n=1 Tax=Neobacillus cucumis TaxID=1740721 RepID=UPI00285339A6|nr:hypothetical protein [Neobacillus cucumis]MDR4948122.1 hypothetical protein [Neobacillus cucumis]